MRRNPDEEAREELHAASQAFLSPVGKKKEFSFIPPVIVSISPPIAPVVSIVSSELARHHSQYDTQTIDESSA